MNNSPPSPQPPPSPKPFHPDPSISETLNNMGVSYWNKRDFHLHGPVTRRLAEKKGIMVVYGTEVTTKEEVHCICLLEKEEQRVVFQEFIEQNLPHIKNNPTYFGHQVPPTKNLTVSKSI
ncbi:MAG: hypothetical protein HYZ42_18275, partial [Bacteroidetes bacterium]|nr:hypothetical protein [Bacteroidota bacterium]